MYVKSAREYNCTPRRGCSSAGRASRSQCEGRGFDPLHLHQTKRPRRGRFCWRRSGDRTTFDPGSRGGSPVRSAQMYAGTSAKPRPNYLHPIQWPTVKTAGPFSLVSIGAISSNRSERKSYLMPANRFSLVWRLCGCGLIVAVIDDTPVPIPAVQSANNVAVLDALYRSSVGRREVAVEVLE